MIVEVGASISHGVDPCGLERVGGGASQVPALAMPRGRVKETVAVKHGSVRVCECDDVNVKEKLVFLLVYTSC